MPRTLENIVRDTLAKSAPGLTEPIRDAIIRSIRLKFDSDLGLESTIRERNELADLANSPSFMHWGTVARVMRDFDRLIYRLRDND